MKKYFLLFCLFVGTTLCAKERVVYCIGDSHSREFSHISFCRIVHIGPITMHRVGRDGVSFVNQIVKEKGIEIRDEQAIVFAFGEIDARCHIGKQRDLQGRPLDDVIHELATKYIETIIAYQKQFQNLLCIVYSVTPPTDTGKNNPLFPRYGSLKDRVNITKKLNAKLAELCRVHNLPFLDVYDDYAVSDGSLNQKYGDGTVHIHSRYYIGIYKKLIKILKP